MIKEVGRECNSPYFFNSFYMTLLDNSGGYFA
jgi:hypothetical protein